MSMQACQCHCSLGSWMCGFGPRSPKSTRKVEQERCTGHILFPRMQHIILYSRSKLNILKERFQFVAGFRTHYLLSPCPQGGACSITYVGIRLAVCCRPLPNCILRGQAFFHSPGLHADVPKMPPKPPRAFRQRSLRTEIARKPQRQPCHMNLA